MQERFDLQRTIHELQAGVSFEENYRRLSHRFRPYLDRFFSRLGVRRGECEDLTQETFLRIYQGIDGFGRQARFESWLFAIATNVYRQHRRRLAAGKRAAAETSLQEVDPETGHCLAEKLVDQSIDGRDSETFLLAQERTRWLLDEVDALPSRMRQCLVLCVFQDLTYEETAVTLRLSPETVRSHLFQARKRLRQGLSLHLGQGGDTSEVRHG